MTFLRISPAAVIASLLGSCAFAEATTDDAHLVFDFTNYLEQLQEPDLRTSCSKEIRIVRLIANPAFSNAWSVRIVRSTKLTMVHTAEGKISSTPTLSTENVDESIWTDLERILDSMDISGISKATDTWIPDDTIATIETCFDGQYDAIQRQFWHPETKELISRLQSLRRKE
jgi:hypothetical protein